MWCDHLDAIALGQIAVQAVTVVCFVADQSCGESIEEAVAEDTFDELTFVRRGAFDTNGERKTVIIGEAMIFVPSPRLVGPAARPPFCAREAGVDKTLLQL